MARTSIAIVGATGNLGTRITRALLSRGARVSALVRHETSPQKVSALEELGVTVKRVSLASHDDVVDAVSGSVCVVSAVQGLHDVIVDGQTALLNAAIAARVPRFIPSDFSTDFTQLPPGQNRNFDLRREFHGRLDRAAIASTAIFNGAFAEILSYNVPLLDFQKHVVGYWEDPDWRMDFTTMDDTAAFTAAAALDNLTPRVLRIASFQTTPRELAKMARDTFSIPFELVPLGSRDDLAAYTRKERAAHPDGELTVYPSWQQSQYMLSMFSTHHETLDNQRYADLTWTTLHDLLLQRKPSAAHDNLG